MNQVEKSQKSGAGFEEVYNPKYEFYESLVFLQPVMSKTASRTYLDDSQTHTDTQLEIQALLDVDVYDNLKATEDVIEEDLVVLPTLPTPQRRVAGRTLFARPQGSAAEATAEATEGIGGEDLVVPETPLRQPIKRTPYEYRYPRVTCCSQQRKHVYS